MKELRRSEFDSLLSDHKVKKKLAEELRFRPEKILDWGDRDFLAVMNRNGSAGVLIAPLDTFYVAAFTLQARVANSKVKQSRLSAIFALPGGGD